MGLIILNNDNLWKWLREQKESSLMGEYLGLIRDNQLNPDYIIRLKNENYAHKSSNDIDIMKNLSLLMPREYFLELHFCAKTFAGICGTIFPPLLIHIEQLAYIEWLLYMEPGYLKYRDHLVHMFKVAFTGINLLANENIINKIHQLQFQSKKTGQPEHFKKWQEENRLNMPEEEKEQKEILKMAFFLAALFHDLGYGYYFLNQYQERLFKINTWLQPGTDLTDINTPFFQKFRKSLSYYFIEHHHMWCSKMDTAIGDKQKKRLVSGFFRDCLPLNHSIASTFTILEIAEKFLETGALNNNLYIAFQLAAEAILIHDLTCEKNWLHLKSDGENETHFLNSESYKSIPLAILLILADELAVWNRYKIRPMQSKKQKEIIFQIDKANVPSSIKIKVLDEEKKLRLTSSYKKPGKSDTDIVKEKIEKLDCFKKDGTPMFMDYKIEFK